MNKFGSQIGDTDPWQVWHGHDFSWDGLEGKPANCYASLRDYWIKTASPDGKLGDTHIHTELIKESGQKTYHIAHLPLHYADGKPTIKTANPDYARELFLNAITIRLNKSAEFDNLGARVPRYFQGIVFPDIPIATVNYPSDLFADFKHSIFCGDPHFRRVIFTEKTQFRHCHFLDEATFSEAQIINADFGNAVFHSDASFSDCVFTAGSSFNHTVFRGDANFSGSTFRQEAGFYGAAFMGSANFARNQFEGQAYFWDTTFQTDTVFSEAVFTDHAFFWNSQFRGRINFGKAQFLRHANLCSAIGSDLLHSPKQLGSISIPDNANDYCAAFDKTIFTEVADFSGWGFCAFSAFLGATFKSGIKLDTAPDDQATANFQKELLQLSKGRDGMEVKPLSRDARLRALEGGCRVLKQEMAKETDKVREHALYRFELLARREQSAVQTSERWASIAYELVSDFGNSFVKPLVTLGLVWLGFAIAYTFFFHPETNTWDDILMSTSLSASRLFPFGGFGTITQIYSDHINQAGNPVGAHLVLYMATLESVLATGLLFLTALGMRRRFQIS